MNKRSLTSQILVSGALALGCLLAYWGVLSADFAGYDDYLYVTYNETVQQGLGVDTVLWALTDTHTGNWHPLTWVSHLLDIEVFGLDARGHHLVNLVYHILNAVLLYLLLVHMTGSIWRSAFVAALFAVHPLNVESVAWIAERKSVLSTFFCFSATCAYLKYVHDRSRGWYIAMCVLFLCGLMSKPILVTFPFMLLLLDYWPLRRSIDEVDSEGLLNSRWVLLVKEKLPLFIGTAALSVSTLFFQREGGNVVSLQYVSMGDRILNMFAGYAFYLKKMFWPSDLVPHYPHPRSSIDPVFALTCAAGLVCITGVCLWLRNRRPYLPMGWFWYLGTLVPVIGIVQASDQAYADRYAYVPLIGAFIMIVWSVPPLRKGTLKIAVVGASILVVTVLTAVTRAQVSHWENAGTLFEHGTSIIPGDAIMQHNLGHYYLKKGDVERAEIHLLATIDSIPDHHYALYSLAVIRLGEGEPEEARDLLLRAVESYSGNVGAWVALGDAYTALGEVQSAKNRYEGALELDGNFPTAHFNLGHLLLMNGAYEEAAGHFWKFLELEPNHADARANLGSALAAQGLLEAALRQLEAAVRADPDHVEARFNLGSLLMRQEKHAEAVPHFETVLEQMPESVDARYNLGLCLLSESEFDEAAKTFRRVLDLDPEHVGAQEGLERTSNRG